MKLFKSLSIILILLASTCIAEQADSIQTSIKKGSKSKLTIEPGVGFAPMSDLIVSNLVQWNFTKRLSVIAHTSYSYNDAFDRGFNYIETNYNYSLNQKFGIGASFYTKHSSHTFSLMAGIKYDTYKETLNNPEFEKVEISDHSASPDFGLMYGIKSGVKKYFFSFRMYLPLYPYPFKTTDINSLDANISNISLEFGIGIRIK